MIKILAESEKTVREWIVIEIPLSTPDFLSLVDQIDKRKGKVVELRFASETGETFTVSFN